MRERSHGMYRTSSYFIAKTLCDIIPMRILPTLFFASITFFMVGYQSGSQHFLTYLSVLILVSFIASAICFVVSAFAPSLQAGNLIAIVVILANILFAGFLVNKMSLPIWLSWIKFLSFLNYAFEILLVNEVIFLLGFSDFRVVYFFFFVLDGWTEV